ncbi:MAG: PAS domain S-box protein [Deltaproteobacteria bacterium]|nr:PAS domain S-box protein [Deltaproteobacteria bacterium]
MVVALSAITLFYKILQKQEHKNLLLVHQIQQGYVDQYLKKLEGIASQVTSRTRIRQVLEEYNQGKISREKLIDFTKPKLLDAMIHSGDIAGICRFGLKNELLIHIGVVIPHPERFIPPSQGQSCLLLPVKVEDDYYLIVGAPIVNRSKQRVGTDIVTFKIGPLQQLTHNFSENSSSGKMILACVSDDIIFILDASGIQSKSSLQFQGDLFAQTLEKVFLKGEGIFILSDDEQAEIQAFGVVAGRKKWAIIINIGLHELYSTIKSYTVMIAGLIAGLILLGTGALILLLRPLSGKILLRQEELEEEVDEKTQILQSELAERRRIENKLAASLKLFETVLDGMEAVVYVCNLESYTVLFANRYTKKIFGEITGKVCWQTMRKNMVGPCPDCPLDKLKNLSIDQDQVLTSEIFNSFNNRWYESHNQEIIWLNGETVKLQVAIDVTERKIAQKSLEESEERLRTLINATPDIVCFKDGYGRWLEANNADLKLFQLEKVDYQGHTDSELAEFTHPLYRQAFLECERSDESAWLKGDVSRGEEVITTIDKTEIILDVIKVPLFDDQQERKGLVVLGRDITEIKKTERQLQLYADTQKSLLREVNHRVKNNLSALIGILNIERDHFVHEDKNSSYSVFLDELITRINGLATVHSQLSASGWQPLRLNQLCEEIIRGVLNSAPRGKDVNVKVEKSRIVIDSNQAHHLAIVINELTTNTLKHGLIPGQAAQILVAMKENDHGVIYFSYKDNGPGFPPRLAEEDLGSSHVGMELIVGIITTSLQGKVTFNNDNGAKVCFHFKNLLFVEDQEDDDA